MSHGLIVDSKELTAGYGYALYQSGQQALSYGQMAGSGVPGFGIPDVYAYHYDITLPFTPVNAPMVFVKNNSSSNFVGVHMNGALIRFVSKVSMTIDYMIFLPTDEYENTSAVYGIKAWRNDRKLSLDASRNNLFVNDIKYCSWVRNYSIQSYAHSLGYVPILMGPIFSAGVGVVITTPRWHSFEYLGLAATSSYIYLKYEQIININDGSYPLNTPLLDARSIPIPITDGS